MNKVDDEYAHLIGMYKRYKVVWSQLKLAMYQRLKSTVGSEVTSEIEYRS